MQPLDDGSYITLPREIIGPSGTTTRCPLDSLGECADTTCGCYRPTRPAVRANFRDLVRDAATDRLSETNSQRRSRCECMSEETPALSSMGLFWVRALDAFCLFVCLIYIYIYIFLRTARRLVRKGAACSWRWRERRRRRRWQRTARDESGVSARRGPVRERRLGAAALGR